MCSISGFAAADLRGFIASHVLGLGGGSEHTGRWTRHIYHFNFSGTWFGIDQAWKLGFQPIPPKPSATPTSTLAAVASPPGTRPIDMPRVVDHTYRVVVSPPNEVSSRPDPVTDQSFRPEVSDVGKEITEMVRKSRLRSLQFRASMECSKKYWGISAGLVRLQNEAVGYLNQYYRYKNSKQMTSDLSLWRKEVETFLRDNREKIPDASIYDFAEGDGGRSIFIGDGQRAWLTMDRKVKALAAMQKQIEAIPCDKIGKAAVVECEESGNCQ